MISISAPRLSGLSKVPPVNDIAVLRMRCPMTVAVRYRKKQKPTRIATGIPNSDGQFLGMILAVPVKSSGIVMARDGASGVRGIPGDPDTDVGAWTPEGRSACRMLAYAPPRPAATASRAQPRLDGE